MARRKKGGLLLGVAGAAVLGALAYGTLSGGGGTVRVADPGGGGLPPPTAAPAPYAIHTLGPIGSAAQDPGGGGGGTGVPGTVGLPNIQGARGSGSAQGTEASSDRLYFSGVNLLDPNPAAATSGQNTFPSAGSAAGAVAGPALGTAASGCAQSADEVDYYAIPLVIEKVSFSGAPHLHLRISGAGPVTATFTQQAPNHGACVPITSGSGGITNGVADFSLGNVKNFQVRKGYTPALTIKAPNGSHTIFTDTNNPSYLFLPNLAGV